MAAVIQGSLVLGRVREMALGRFSYVVRVEQELDESATMHGVVYACT